MPSHPGRTVSASFEDYPPSPEYPNWQAVVADAVRDPAELCRLLNLPPSAAEAATRAAGDFPLLVPRTYLSRIRIGNPVDPLLLQVLPTEDEIPLLQGFTKDPVGEIGSALPGGMLWKYRGRVLIVTTGVCAVHCRFCFRRHFPYREAAIAQRHHAALERVANEPSVHEIILSGGDPLSMGDKSFSRLVDQLEAIPHLRRLRIHTRQPILVPQRITEELLATLSATRMTAIVVLHINHPAEIDGSVETAIGRLVDAGIPLLQQGVLLRRINDQADVLAELYERLVELRVMPYYLHQLDRVAGASHFEVPQTEAVRLIDELRRRLPGYAVPRFVQEIPSAPNKTVLA